MLEPGDTLIPFSDGLLDLYDGTLAALDEIVEVVRATTSAGTVATFAERARTVPLLADDVAVVVTRRAPR